MALQETVNKFGSTGRRKVEGNLNKPEKKRTTSSRKDYYTMITLLTVIGALLFRIPLGHLIGDKGIACFGTANEIYLVIAGTVAYGLSEAVAVLVKYRVKREQFKSAQKVLSGALFLGGSIGLIFSVFFGFLGHFVAEKIMHMPLAGLSISLMAPAMFFLILTGIFRGYFQGNGSRMPSMHSQILHMIFMFIGGLIGAALLHGYGVKVSLLLQNEDYTSAYGAMGASLGFLSASILCFLHSFILYFIYRNSLRRQVGRELQKSQDTGLHIFYMLIATGALHSLFWVCFNGLPLIDQYLVFLFGDDVGETAALWGAYYGKCLVLLGVLGGVINIICLSPVRRILGFAEREDHRAAREKLGILIHQCAVIAIPSTVFLAVLSENILELLFSGDQHQTAVWIQICSIIIVFYVFATVFMDILIKSRRMKYVVLIGSGAFILHAGLLMLLLKAAKLGITAVLIANIVFYVLVAGIGFLLISRSFQYTQEWIRSFAITIVASAISGVIAMLLNKVFAPMLGTTISMIICLLVGIISYMVLLLVTRAFRDGELEEMAGGRILIMLAGILHLS